MSRNYEIVFNDFTSHKGLHLYVNTETNIKELAKELDQKLGKGWNIFDYSAIWGSNNTDLFIREVLKTLPIQTLQDLIDILKGIETHGDAFIFYAHLFQTVDKSSFEEKYIKEHYSTFREFAEEVLYKHIGNITERFQKYINLDKWAIDLLMQYAVVQRETKAYIFRK